MRNACVAVAATAVGKNRNYGCCCAREAKHESTLPALPERHPQWTTELGQGVRVDCKGPALTWCLPAPRKEKGLWHEAQPLKKASGIQLVVSPLRNHRHCWASRWLNDRTAQNSDGEAMMIDRVDPESRCARVLDRTCFLLHTVRCEPLLFILSCRYRQAANALITARQRAKR